MIIDDEMVEEIILNTIREYELIEKGHYVILGLSGGPDSVCLFDVLEKAAKEIGFTLSAVHVNHKLRPGAAEEDQAYVENLCKERGVKCSSFAVDCHAFAEENAMTDEEAGRAIRYDCFAAAAEELVSSGVPRDKIRIAVAQNADDQVETVLFRIMRGTGTDGLSGISILRKDEHGNTVIRPLLKVSKKEIWEYCEEAGLKPRIDHTNAETEYTRNRIRHLLLPFMEEKFNREIRKAVLRLGASAAADRDYFRRCAGNFLRDHTLEEEKNSILLDGEALRGLHRAVRSRVMAAAFSRLGLKQDLAAPHYQALEEILRSDSPSTRADLPHGYYMARVYDHVRFACESGEDERKVLTEFEPCRCDAEKAEAVFGKGWEDRVEIRDRLPGDFIRIKGGGRKKIQDLLVDMKVPKGRRDRVKVTACGREVLAVVIDDKNVRYTAGYKSDESTKKVIDIEINTVL